MSGPVVAYRPEWAEEFAAERERLIVALRSWSVTDVQHIGSTSIEGMPAKPIIDMMAAVADLDVGRAAEPALAELGYEQHPHRVDAVLHVRAVDGAHTHHLHLTTPDSRLWLERITFRDAVRTDGDLAAEYRDLKSRLLADNDGQVYSSADKREFVRRVLAGAGVDLVDGLHERPPALDDRNGKS